ncbi:PilN domain-containing protein [Gluconacetobacter diazotrophicus]|nr:PilN domain-containing protein [Gluconacetobacter diazotrophicus]AAM92873.1 LsdL [Gluconacetobacter diazotrophicus]TWB09848.1 general secretion pathway protein L [Gluconacetobacter diazotrophicus]CAP54429.1 putative general secretion pathway protein L [Gluconacetobacter diazotrophicus PA1 5]
MIMRDLFAWWWRQVREMIPGWHRLSRSARSVLVVEWAAGRLDLSLRKGDRQNPVATCAMRDGAADEAAIGACRTSVAATWARDRPGATVLLLPPGMMMRRDVTLPAAAEAALDSVLAYEMDRLTPFPADRIVYAYDVLRRDADLKQVQVRLTIVPRASVAPVLGLLDRIGLQPDLLRDGPQGAGIPLDAGRARQAGRRRTRLAAACAAVLLPLAVVGAGFWRQSVEQDRLAARIATLRPAADQAATLRRRIEDSSAGNDIVAAQRARLGDPMEVLAATTRLLPDDTVLTDLILRQGQLIISGQSATATGLIETLSKDPVFRNPVFVAPVTRVEGQNASLFSIRADVGR